MEDKNQQASSSKLIPSPPHHLKSRLIVSLILLGLSILGVFVAALVPTWAWHYWLYMSPVFALLCLWLSWHVSKKHKVDGKTIWREILHWLALLLVVYFVSVIVNTGFISSLVGALFVLILLSFSLILAGIHFDWFYIPIGLLLAVLAICSIYFAKYLTIVIVPIAIIVGIFFIWWFLSRKPAEL